MKDFPPYYCGVFLSVDLDKQEGERGIFAYFRRHCVAASRFIFFKDKALYLFQRAVGLLEFFFVLPGDVCGRESGWDAAALHPPE